MGRHVVVTGAGRGIGAAVARRFGGERLTLMGRGLDALKATAGDLPEAQAVPCDVTDAAAVADAFTAARSAYGPIEVLVNNAGQAGSAPFGRITDEVWQQMLAVNLTGTFLCTRDALTDMLAVGYGRIVNIASTAGLRGYPYVAAYVAAKHGVIGLTRALAAEVAATPITVNAVCPGFTETDLLDESIANVASRSCRTLDEARGEFVKYNPQGRFITVTEVADAVAWLCSDSAGSVTGQSISISGGEVT